MLDQATCIFCCATMSLISDQFDYLRPQSIVVISNAIHDLIRFVCFALDALLANQTVWIQKRLYPNCLLAYKIKSAKRCSSWVAVKGANTLHAGEFCLLRRVLTPPPPPQKKKIINTTRVSNNLGPDQTRRIVGPCLGPSCLQRLSTEDVHAVRQCFSHINKRIMPIALLCQ